ncbi:hypothetical protein Barb7_02703 [Bacteroidales bacterium Barb7]|nr:hypothetical protein Barb7_02703 [Bacteroidales bacterium Barb7]
MDEFVAAVPYPVVPSYLMHGRIVVIMIVEVFSPIGGCFPVKERKQ